MGTGGNVPIQLVLEWVSINPVLHDAQAAAPFTGQFNLVCARPFLHVQLLAVDTMESTSSLACADNNKPIYVLIHIVLAPLSVYPGLHDAHCGAPNAGQPVPASATP